MGPGSGSRFATRSTSTCSPGPDGEAYEATIVNNLYARSVFFVKDAERSLRFYSETLGFSLDWKYEEQGRAFVLQVSLLGFELILNQTGPQTEDRADRKPLQRRADVVAAPAHARFQDDRRLSPRSPGSAQGGVPGVHPPLPATRPFRRRTAGH